jgi:Flavin containing amine oxidoreductase
LTIAFQALITFSVSSLYDQATSGVINLPSDRLTKLVDTFYIDTASPEPFTNTMGLYKLLFVQLSDGLWSSYASSIPNNEFIFAVPPTTQPFWSASGARRFTIGQCTVWQNVDTGYQGEFFVGSHTFLCTLTTKDFTALTAGTPTGSLSDDVANDLIASTLFKVLGIPATVRCDRSGVRLDHFPDPITGAFDPSPPMNGCHYYISDGPNNADQLDQSWLGAWSTLREGWTRSDYDDIIEPYGNLHFGGEAYCLRWTGFQHGAWDSGRLEARNILQQLYNWDTSKIDEWNAYSNNLLSHTPVCDFPQVEACASPPVRKAKSMP